MKPCLIVIDAAMASGLVRPLEGLVDFSPASQFIKHRHGALVGTGLDVRLTQHGIGRLIVSGIRTEQCCETTARHAWDCGWEVDHVLDGRFAHVCNAAEAPQRLGERERVAA